VRDSRNPAQRAQWRTTSPPASAWSPDAAFWRSKIDALLGLKGRRLGRPRTSRELGRGQKRLGVAFARRVAQRLGPRLPRRSRRPSSPARGATSRARPRGRG
jgi:hypothetical protein